MFKKYIASDILNKVMKFLEDKLAQYSHAVFLDFEGTQFSHEMIAIGAVKVDLKKDKSIRKIYKGFKRFVIPKEKIGSFVINLTGITPETIKSEGISFSTMLEQFKQYVKTPLNKCIFITFGTHDLKILKESVAHSFYCDALAAKTMMKNYLDLSEVVGEFVRDENGNIYSLLNYLSVFGEKPEGDAHDPLYDAINLAKLYSAMIKHPEILETNYKQTILKRNKFPHPIVSILQMLSEGKTVAPEDYEKFIKEYVEK